MKYQIRHEGLYKKRIIAYVFFILTQRRTVPKLFDKLLSIFGYH